MGPLWVRADIRLVAAGGVPLGCPGDQAPAKFGVGDIENKFDCDYCGFVLFFQIQESFTKRTTGQLG